MASSGMKEGRLTRNGVFAIIFRLAEASESGGDGGVGTSEMVDVSDLAGGGVEIVGDEVVVRETSDLGDLLRRLAVDGKTGLLLCKRSIATSAVRSFSPVISASTRRSESSSRRRCVSMRSVSRS